MPVAELCRKHGFSDASYYKWKAKFGGMEVSDAKRGALGFIVTCSGCKERWTKSRLMKTRSNHRASCKRDALNQAGGQYGSQD